MQKIFTKLKTAPLYLAAAAAVAISSTSPAMADGGDDFGIGEMALDLSAIEAVIAIVIPGLFLLWAIHKVVKTTNRS